MNASTSPLPSPPAQGFRLLREREAAEYLGFSPRSLQNWRLRGGGPRYIKISPRAVRYREEDLLAWLAPCVRTSTSASGAPAAPAAR